MGSARVVLFLVLEFVLLNFSFIEARNYRVSWKIPSQPDRLNHWASKMRFLIGDSLKMKFDPKSDSVLQVTEESYNTCNPSNPIKTYDNGDSKIVLDQSGAHYFISGAEGHCQKGEKMKIWVLSAKHGVKGRDPAVAVPVTSPAKSPAPARVPPGLGVPAPSPGGGVRVNGGRAVAVVAALVVVSLVLW